MTEYYQRVESIRAIAPALAAAARAFFEARSVPRPKSEWHAKQGPIAFFARSYLGDPSVPYPDGALSGWVEDAEDDGRLSLRVHGRTSGMAFNYVEIEVTEGVTYAPGMYYPPSLPNEKPRNDRWFATCYAVGGLRAGSEQLFPEPNWIIEVTQLLERMTK